MVKKYLITGRGLIYEYVNNKSQYISPETKKLVYPRLVEKSMMFETDNKFRAEYLGKKVRYSALKKGSLNEYGLAMLEIEMGNMEYKHPEWCI